MPIFIVFALLLTGCMNITTHLAPIRQDVKATLTGQDCTRIFFGIGFGTSTMEQAMRHGHTEEESWDTYGTRRPGTPILAVRSVAFNEKVYGPFGERCVEVTGE